MLLRFKLTWYKFTNWEYWPTRLIYASVAILWVWYSLKNRSFYSFAYTNPSLPNGGMMNTNKLDIYKCLPSYTYPNTIGVHQENWKEVKQILINSKIKFPLIVKPSYGLRGISVSKLNNINELKTYHQNRSHAYIIQALIHYKNEIGVFYIRYPNTKHGKITGITGKKFLTIKGDGVSSIEQLLLKENRYALQLKRLSNTHNLSIILPKGEFFEIEPIGNHNLGTTFLDFSNKITPELTTVFDQLSHQIKGIYYGRYDIRFHDWKSLYQGKLFQIIELNGALAEPTHIYDPKHGFWFGQFEIFKHHKEMFKIANENLKSGHSQRKSFRYFRQQIKQHRKKINQINNT